MVVAMMKVSILMIVGMDSCVVLAFGLHVSEVTVGLR